MNSNKGRKLKIGFYIDRTSSICSILSFIIANIEWFKNIPYIDQFIKFIPKYKSIIVIILITIVILRYIIYVIPNYKIHMEDKASQEVKPSNFSIVMVILISMALIINSFINLDKNTISSKADNTTVTQNDQMEITNIDEEQVDDKVDEDIDTSNSLTEEDKNIEKYIKMARDEIISKEVLKTLSLKELYYIRNGILAYEGLYFESGYYERFSWYTGHILSEEEIWGELNTYQYTNIQNIKEIEKEINSILE